MDVKVNGGCAAPTDLKNIFAVFPHMHTLGTHISLSVTKHRCEQLGSRAVSVCDCHRDAVLVDVKTDES